MPTQAYHLKDGTRVPSVTTVIGRFKEAGGLIHWAWDLGKQGKDYREVRDNAASAGTLAHAQIEAWIKNPGHVFVGSADEIGKRAYNCYQAFLGWAGQSNLRVTHTEVPMVSEAFRYGGTMDAILLGNRRAIGDWKTSGKIYPEYLVQLAAYGRLWEENHPEEKIDGGFHLLRFDKEFADFHHHYWGELEAGWKAFLHLRALYDLDKELKQRAK